MKAYSKYKQGSCNVLNAIILIVHLVTGQLRSNSQSLKLSNNYQHMWVLPNHNHILSLLSRTELVHILISSFINRMQKGMVEYPNRLLFHLGTMYCLLLLVEIFSLLGNRYENFGFCDIFSPKFLVNFRRRSEIFCNPRIFKAAK